MPLIESLNVAEKVGYPIMIKASEGGGGKGVRKATEASQIETMYQQVADEVRTDDMSRRPLQPIPLR